MILRGEAVEVCDVVIEGKMNDRLAWQINPGIGIQMARNIFTEATYRLYDVNYRHNGLIFDILTHGPELSIGINF
jgi:hypothetical protein